jgi:hypothetical protein
MQFKLYNKVVANDMNNILFMTLIRGGNFLILIDQLVLNTASLKNTSKYLNYEFAINVSQ